MSEFEVVYLGGPGCVEASVGYREHRQRHASRQARAARGRSVAHLRRHLELQEIADGNASSRAQVPAKASAVVSLLADARGQFHAQATVAGHRMNMLVDTGATICCLTHDDAVRAGVKLRPSDFTWRLSTVGGATMGAPVLLGSLQVGAIIIRDVEAAVVRRSPGEKSLLGMSFLSRLREVSMERGRFVLRG